MSKGARHDDVVEITTARASAANEMRHRQRRYLFSMSLRTICFVGAIVTPPPFRWFLVAGALVLPYIAVVMANVASPILPGSGPESPGPGYDEHPALPSGRAGHAPGS